MNMLSIRDGGLRGLYKTLVVIMLCTVVAFGVVLVACPPMH
jgi:hypothetical protein